MLPLTPPGCCCPQGAWFGVVPPYCPVHSPPQRFSALPASPVWSEEYPAALADADVERIARRVVELLAPPASTPPEIERCMSCGHPRDNHPYRHQFVAFAQRPGVRAP